MTAPARLGFDVKTLTEHGHTTVWVQARIDPTADPRVRAYAAGVIARTFMGIRVGVGTVAHHLAAAMRECAWRPRDHDGLSDPCMIVGGHTITDVTFRTYTGSEITPGVMFTIPTHAADRILDAIEGALEAVRISDAGSAAEPWSGR